MRYHFTSMPWLNSSQVKQFWYIFDRLVMSMEIPARVPAVCDKGWNTLKMKTRTLTVLLRSGQPTTATTECNGQKVDVLIIEDWMVMVGSAAWHWTQCHAGETWVASYMHFLWTKFHRNKPISFGDTNMFLYLLILLSSKKDLQPTRFSILYLPDG
jgi:hypothetical protein